MSTSAYSTLGDTDAPIFSIQPEPATKAVKGKGKVQSKQVRVLNVLPNQTEQKN